MAWICLLVSVLATAKHVWPTIHISPAQPWKYLSKFAISPGTGHWSLRVSLPSPPSSLPPFLNLHLSLYQHSNWPAAVSSPTCTERISLLSSDRVVTALTDGTWSDPLTGALSQSALPEVWYFVLSDCGDLLSEQLLIHTDLTFTNSDGSQFSSEDLDVPWMYVWGAFPLVGLIAVSVRRAKAHWVRTETGDPSLIMLGIATGLQAIAVLLAAGQLTWYSYDGSGLRILAYFSQIAAYFSQFSLDCVLLLKATGWTLNSKLKPDFDTFVPVIGVIAVINVSTIILGKYSDDGYNRFSDYDGLPGMILIASRLGLCAWFLVSVLTLKRGIVPPQRSFLACFRLFGAMYFLSIPLIVLYSWSFPVYLHKKISTGGALLVQIAAFGVLSWLYSPSSPYYHISTLSAPVLPHKLR